MTSDVPGDLWPTNLFSTALRAPVTLLREQALLLAEKSSRLIVGRVQSERTEYDNSVQHSLRARVPDLGNYEVEIVRIEHEAQRLYPVFAHRRDGGDHEQIQSEQRLVEWLRRELGSDWVVQTIQTLVAQVRDPEARPPDAPRANKGRVFRKSSG